MCSENVIPAYILQARNIKNLPIVNRDIQSIRFEEMQTEIKVTSKLHEHV